MAASGAIATWRGEREEGRVLAGWVARLSWRMGRRSFEQTFIAAGTARRPSGCTSGASRCSPRATGAGVGNIACRCWFTAAPLQRFSGQSLLT